MFVRDEVRQKQDEILRGLSPESRLRISLGLRNAAWELKAAAIRQACPDCPEAEVQAAVRQLFRDASA